VGIYSGGVFLYSGGSYTTLPNVPGSPLGINDAGQIVGGYSPSPSGPLAGFIYSQGVYTTLSDPAAVWDTQARGINNAGEVMGWYIGSGGLAHGFIYSNGNYTNIDNPQTSQTYFLGLNDEGEIVQQDTFGSYIFSNGVFTPVSGIAAYDINNAGQIIGNSIVPLPAALPLFATGLVGLGLLGWRRKRKAIAA
jgi:probable HAF family extracellular repeat protein